MGTHRYRRPSHTCPMPTDPSWFYSSLAQSAAAVVGFVGAFLIFRVQDYMTNWAHDLADLEALQRRWVPAHVDVETQEKDWYRALDADPGRDEPSRDQFVRFSLERERDELWRNLRLILDRRRLATFPRELVQMAALIGLLLLVGTLGPLLALGAPSNVMQVGWLAAVAVLIVATASAMILRARTEFRRLKEYRLFPLVDSEYEEQLIWEDEANERERIRRASTAKSGSEST